VPLLQQIHVGEHRDPAADRHVLEAMFDGFLRPDEGRVGNERRCPILGVNRSPIFEALARRAGGTDPVG
jgi:hypothetical protein